MICSLSLCILANGKRGHKIAQQHILLQDNYNIPSSKYRTSSKTSLLLNKVIQYTKYFILLQVINMLIHLKHIRWHVVRQSFSLFLLYDLDGWHCKWETTLIFKVKDNVFLQQRRQQYWYQVISISLGRSLRHLIEVCKARLLWTELSHRLCGG